MGDAAGRDSMNRTRGSLLDPGIDAVRHNWRPFLLIQICAVSLVFAYYNSLWLQQATVGLAKIQVAGGLLFSALSTAFAGVVLPELAKRATNRRLPWPTAFDFTFQACFFATLGSFVDLNYRLWALLLGNGVDLATVATKVALDMGLFSTTISIPMSTVCFLWRDTGFDFDKTRAALREGEFKRRFAPLMVTCWSFWIPCLMAVYAMPRNLQFSLFLVVQAAWSLLLVHMTSERRSRQAAEGLVS